MTVRTRSPNRADMGDVVNLPAQIPVRRPARTRQRAPSAAHGAAVHERAVRERGRTTVRRLLEAGLAEFGERGFQAVTVDDIVRRASTSHGTFYLYFANKDDFFGALAHKALRALDAITSQFPLVTHDDAGRAALRAWVIAFCDTYQAHATVIKILSHADLAARGAPGNGLRWRLFRLADVVSMSMTADGTRARHGDGRWDATARLDAVACLMMLERVNYLLSSGVELPKAQMIDRLTDIIVAAFPAAHPSSTPNEREPARPRG